MQLKKLLFFIFVTLTILFLAACGGNNATNSSNNQGNDNNQSEQTEKSDKTWKLRMSSAFTPPATETEPKYQATERFADLIRERTDGRVEIEIYYSNQLVPQAEALDAARSRTIDIANTAAYWGDRIPSHDFVWLPFAFLGTDHYLYLMNETVAGEVFEQEMEEHGVKVLNHWSSGFNGIISTKPVTQVSDLEGMSMRIASGVWEPWYRAMGVAPANIAAAEQYQALSQGIIDATVFPYFTIETYNFYEVAKHITTPGILSPTMAMNFISLDVWNEFPSDIQDIIMDVAKEVEAESMKIVTQEHENTLKFAAEKGMTVHELTSEQLSEFQSSAEVVFEEFAARSVNNEKMYKALLESYKKFQ